MLRRFRPLSLRTCLIVTGIFSIATYLFFCPILNEPLYQLLAVMPNHEYIDTAKPCTMGAYTGEHKFFPVLGAAVPTMLHGVYFRTNNKSSKGIVIINPGNAFCLTHMLGCRPFLAILSLGWDLFVYDYEGYGESQGAARYNRLGQDALSAYSFVRDKLKQSPIVLYGMSMGGGISSYVAERLPVAGVIYDSPFISPERTAKDWFPILNIYPSKLFPEPSYSNSIFLRGKHCPALIITKGRDSICWPTQGVELAKIASAPTSSVVLPNSEHLYVDAADEGLYKDALTAFLDSLSADAGGSR